MSLLRPMFPAMLKLISRLSSGQPGVGFYPGRNRVDWAQSMLQKIFTLLLCLPATMLNQPDCVMSSLCDIEMGFFRKIERAEQGWTFFGETF